MLTLYFPPSVASASASASSTGLSTVSANSSLSQKINKEIDRVTDIKKPLEDRQSNQNNPLTEEENKRLSDCESKLQALQTVSKLAEFAEQLDTNKSNTNNILNNLCTGLQTFLGFNSASKGYDGTGIVYSDLDRLCDGVMGFLYGVLEGVKDDENVKHYYPVTYMNNTIDCIKNSMHKGPSEYHLAVVAAAQALELWNGDLVKRTDALKNEFDTLITTNFNYIADSLSKLNYVHGDSLSTVAEKLQNCINDADLLSNAYNSTESVYNTLDRSLRDKLQCSLNNVKLQVKQFVAAAQNTQLKQLLEFSEKQAIQLETAVRSKVMHRVNQLGSDINAAFESQIKKPINDVNEKLTNVEKDIKAWIRVAGTVVEEVKTKAREIHSRLVARVEKIITDAKEVEDEADRKVTAMLDKVKSLLGDSRKNSVILDKAYREAREQLKWLHASGAAAFHTAEATANNVNMLDEKIKNVLASEMKEVIFSSRGLDANGVKEEISKLVQAVSAAIGNLSSAIVGVQEESVKGLVRRIKEQISAIKPSIQSVVHPLLVQHANTAAESNLTTLNRITDALVQKYDKALQIPKASPPKVGVEDKSIADKVDEAINAVKLKVNNVNIDFQDAQQFKDLNQTVHRLQNTLKEIKNFSEYLVAQETGMHANVVELGKQLRQRREALSSLITAVENADITHHIGDVWNTLGDAKTIVVKYIRNAARHFNALTDELTKLQGELSGAKENDVINRLEYLLNHGIRGSSDWNDKENAKGLTEIQKRIDGILSANKDGNLKQILKDAKAFNTSVIIAEGTRAMNEIQQYVSNEVATVTRAIQNEAKTDYHWKTNSIFEAMKTKVKYEIVSIKRTINEDLSTGVKGLLRKVMDHDRKDDDDTNMLKKLKNIPENTKTINFKNLSECFKNYGDPILQYIIDQVTTKLPGEQGDNVSTIKDAFDKLFVHLQNDSKKYNYDNDFVKFRDSLSTSLASLRPSHFANPRHPELLDAVRQGLQGFVEELERVYVNGYDGHKEKVDMGKLVDNGGNTDGKLTDDGRNLSKVFLTILDLLHAGFNTLTLNCGGGWKSDKIKKSTLLGKFLDERGYVVSTDKQEGELRNDEKFKGDKVKELCVKKINHLSPEAKKVIEVHYSTAGGIELNNLLNIFYTILVKYRKVCNYYIPAKSQPPTTVYQMLHWLAAMEYTPMYEQLRSYLKKFYTESTAEYKLGESLEVAIPFRCGGSMITTVDGDRLVSMFDNVTLRAYKILVAICGHGQEDGRYACDFYTNPDHLVYPGRDSACFEQLVEVCLRLNHQLRFLFRQCHNDTTRGGWSDCWYGRGIGGSSWNCNEVQRPDQSDNQQHQQTCDQKGNQNCDQSSDQSCHQRAQCGIKSPLQSFLEDGLPGFLPHPYSNTGCKLTCSLPNHFGKPCLTPMGFRNLGVTASHKQKGERIRKVLEGFSGPMPQSMSWLCAHFLLLLRRPPQTLDDMFAFYYNYLEHWGGVYGSKVEDVKKHKRDAFDEAVQKANFGDAQTELDVTSIQHSSEHENDKKTHGEGDLFTLLYCNTTATPALPCGRYVQSMSEDTRVLYCKQQASTYLSWVVYITETFYDLLKKLRDECCKKCNKNGITCCGRKCGKECQVDYTKNDKAKQPQNQQHKEICRSILNCPDTHPTIFAAGFTFGSPYELSGGKGQERKRTCQDFCHALEKICDGKSRLADLVINKIPAFLWEIREKFFWTTVALWSASFLYLIYVMVGRLDLLHIKSHLRSPASHRITAQSLLAAARVGRLSKIAYLQP